MVRPLDWPQNQTFERPLLLISKAISGGSWFFFVVVFIKPGCQSITITVFFHTDSANTAVEILSLWPLNRWPSCLRACFMPLCECVCVCDVLFFIILSVNKCAFLCRNCSSGCLSAILQVTCWCLVESARGEKPPRACEWWLKHHGRAIAPRDVLPCLQCCDSWHTGVPSLMSMELQEQRSSWFPSGQIEGLCGNIGDIIWIFYRTNRKLSLNCENKAGIKKEEW